MITNGEPHYDSGGDADSKRGARQVHIPDGQYKHYYSESPASTAGRSITDNRMPAFTGTFRKVIDGEGGVLLRFHCNATSMRRLIEARRSVISFII
jgi:hypothetical protein